MQISDVIIAAVFGGIGLLISRIADAFKLRRESNASARKVDVETDISKNVSDKKLNNDEMQQALNMYKDLINELKKDMRSISDDMKELEKAHITTREENASLKKEIEFLKQEGLHK